MDEPLKLFVSAAVFNGLTCDQTPHLSAVKGRKMVSAISANRATRAYLIVLTSHPLIVVSFAVAIWEPL